MYNFKSSVQTFSFAKKRRRSAFNEIENEKKTIKEDQRFYRILIIYANNHYLDYFFLLNIFNEHLSSFNFVEINSN